MSDLICVTNRTLCKEPFLDRLEKIAEGKPGAILLREKDLPERDYIALAGQVMEICKRHQVPCILHSFVDAALQLHADSIHLPLPILRGMTEQQKGNFARIGTSCHSVSDAVEAQRLGCSYIIAGHIYATDCKKGVAPRGLDFLADVCGAVSLPVYGIGGISHQNYPCVIEAGAKGACVMSGLMSCENPKEYIGRFQHE